MTNLVTHFGRQPNILRLCFAPNACTVRSRFCAFLPRERERFLFNAIHCIIIFLFLIHIKIAESSFVSFTTFLSFQPLQSQSLFFCVLIAFFSFLFSLRQSTVNFLPFLSSSESAQWMCIILKLFTCCYFFTYHEFLWLFSLYY